MTAADKAGATTHVAPALPDLPPPHAEGEDRFDSASMGPVKQLWDVTAVYGPISRAELHKHRPVTSWNYREYLRWHPEVKGDTSMSTLMKADRWIWDRAIDLSIEQGWLTTDDKDRYVVAAIPPEHRPLATKPKELIEAELAGDSTDAAMKILIAKVNLARMKPQTVQKNALKRDLQERGQLQPIKVWKPSPMVHEHEIIVDGVTRAGLLEELGIEPWKVYLPENTSPTEVLLQRISHELHPTTKDTSKEARDEYILKLSELGFDHAKIAKQVGLSRNRVAAILSAMSAYGLRTTPSLDDINYMVMLRAAGWNQADIAERTQWSQKTVSKYLAISPEAPAATADGDTATKEPPPKQLKFLRALHELGSATEKVASEHAGISGRDGAMMKRLRDETKYIYVVGGKLSNRSDPAQYALTPHALSVLAPYLGEDSEPKPELEPDDDEDDAALATVTPLPRREPDVTSSAPAPRTPKPPVSHGGRTIESVAASIEKVLKRGGFTREQVIEYWNEHPVMDRDA